MPSKQISRHSLKDIARRQLLLLASLWLAGAVIACALVVHETNEMFDNALIETARVISEFEAQQDIAIVERIALAGDRRTYMSFQIRNGAGDVQKRSRNAPEKPYDVPLQKGLVWSGVHRVVTQPLPQGTFLQVSEFYDERRDAFVGLVAGLLVPLMALLGIGSLLVRRSIARIGKPLLALNDELRNRDDANMEPLDANELPAELMPVVEETNSLLQRLKHAFDAERAFSANCAHELRNPIASARAQIELLASNPEDPTLPERLRTVEASLTTIGQRIERLLQLGRADAGIGLSNAPADLADITRMLVADHASRGADIVLHDSAPSVLEVSADADAIGIIVQNLIDNALAYAGANTRVDVRIGHEGVLRVINDCAAVDRDLLAGLSQRFKRKRGAKIGGYGIGLSIVGALVEQVGGRVELKSPATGRDAGFETVVHFRRWSPPGETYAELTS